MAKKQNENDGLKAAREASKETLNEQENMTPVPSQEEADRIKLGEQVEAKSDQPDGPAAEAEADVNPPTR